MAVPNAGELDTEPAIAVRMRRNEAADEPAEAWVYANQRLSPAAAGKIGRRKSRFQTGLGKPDRPAL